MRLLILAYFTINILSHIRTQSIEIQDISHNEGYVPIKLEDRKLVKNYVKVLHIINITEYEVTSKQIFKNIEKLEAKSSVIGPMLNTIKHNYNLLENKIDFLKPHTKIKRALFDIVGKGLKFIAGTMDSGDALEIQTKLDSINLNINNIIYEDNKQVKINQDISDQIKNITNHIASQQYKIETYLNNFTNITNNRISNLEEEITYIQYIYQLNYDINLLKNHIDDIDQVIMTSKLGILTRNILTPKEIEMIPSIEASQYIKIMVTFYKNQIVIILLIPQLTDTPLSKILIEPIPNKQNKSLHIKEKYILVDKNKNIFYSTVKDDLKKNLIEVKDDCIKNIIRMEEANCDMQFQEKEEISEITKGIIVTKNIKNTLIIQNCNDLKINIEGNKLIKIENCKININNMLFENQEKKIHDHIILPNFLTKIKEKVTFYNLDLEKLNLNNIKNRDRIDLMTYQNHAKHISTWVTQFVILIILTTLLFIMYKRKTKIVKINVKQTSSEPQTNAGGVIVSTTTPHNNII